MLSSPDESVRLGDEPVRASLGDRETCPSGGGAEASLGGGAEAEGAALTLPCSSLALARERTQSAFAGERTVHTGNQRDLQICC